MEELSCQLGYVPVEIAGDSSITMRENRKALLFGVAAALSREYSMYLLVKLLMEIKAERSRKISLLLKREYWE